MAFRVAKWFKIPLIRGKVVDASGTPLANVFVRIFLQESNQLMSLLVTNKDGSFKAFLPKGEYQVALSKNKYIWVDNGQALNFYLADARKSRPVILAVMEDASKLYKELFS
jgi:5-hydroxyisourate hydrolase-like protein (transthyretin family)